MMSKTPLKLARRSERNEPTAVPGTVPWKILVVDDEPEVHDISRLIIGKIVFRDRPVKLLSAFSAKEAEEILRREDDIALVLLDVVMETEDAGLNLVRTIRLDLRNNLVRIVLRTGQPGQAPEQRVIVDYDINDYKAKTELTAQKLFTTVIASLRSYADIVALDTNRVALGEIIESSADLFRMQSMKQFGAGVLSQVSAFLKCQPNGVICIGDNVDEAGCGQIYASAGVYAQCLDCTFASRCRHPEVARLTKKTMESGHNIYDGEFVTLFLDAGEEGRTVVLLHTPLALDEMDRQLLEVFTSKIALGFKNVMLVESLEEKVAARTKELEDAKAALEKLAATDPLTGAMNRRAFDRCLANELARAERYESPLSLLSFDIDHFKRVNDQFGHPAGDRVLVELVRLASETLRGIDGIARLGGEEFVVVLPSTDIGQATEAAERLRAAVEGKSVALEDGGSVTVTVSIGAVSFDEAEGDAKQALSLADARLYRAKDQGRNRVVAD